MVRTGTLAGYVTSTNWWPKQSRRRDRLRASAGWTAAPPRSVRRGAVPGCCAGVWWVPDFIVDRYRERLRDLDVRIRAEGPFVAHSTRHLVQARR